MIEDEFTFHHLESEDDIEQNLEIMRTVFGRNAGVDLLVRKLLYNHPKMTLGNHYVIKHHGRIVATLNLIPVAWGIGSVPLKAAEMGCVATLAEYRNQGLMQRLVEKYHEHVDAQGFDLSVIEGIPYFYRQFGYDYALPLDEETRIPIQWLPSGEHPFKIRPFTDKDISRGMELLAETQGKFLVHVVRDEVIWKMQEEMRMASEYAFDGYAVEKESEMVAYFRISSRRDEKELVLREITDSDQPTDRAILAFLRETGMHQGLDTLVSRTSHSDPITSDLVALGAKQNFPYAWQIRVTNHMSLLDKMKPLFDARLAASECYALTERVNFNFRRYVIQMAIENGSIAGFQRLETGVKCAVGVNPLVFVKLLLGYKSREELEMCYPDFNVRAEHKKLIDVLFPTLPSFIHAGY